MENKEDEFLKDHITSIEFDGFWKEGYKEIMLSRLLGLYNSDIIRDYFISDLIVRGEKVLLKWTKRFRSLTEQELKEQYGR